MAPEPKRFQITTTAQVERTYVVEGQSAEQAHKRLRAHLADADSLREGIVVKLDEDVDSTPQRVKGDPTPVKPASATTPKLVESTG